MSTEATKQQSIHYGCLVIDNQTGKVNHYVEKPSSYLSTFINCGVYVCSLDVFARIAAVFHSRDLNYAHANNQTRDQGYIEWEQGVLTPMAGSGKLFAIPVSWTESGELDHRNDGKDKSSVSIAFHFTNDYIEHIVTWMLIIATFICE